MAKAAILQPTEVPFTIESGNYVLGAGGDDLTGIASVYFEADDGVNTPVSDTVTARANFLKHVTLGSSRAKAKYEYWTTLNLSSLDDGPVTITITATPSGGGETPKTFTYTVLNNSSSSFTPLIRYVDSVSGSDSNDGLTPETARATIYSVIRQLQSADGSADCGGHIIYCAAGSYAITRTGGGPYPITVRSWLTIAAAPGESKSSVTITSAGDCREINHIRLRDVTFNGATINPNSLGGTGDDYAWFDFCDLVGTGTGLAQAAYRWCNTDIERQYFTECVGSNVVIGLSRAYLVRDCEFHTVGGSIVQALRGGVWNLLSYNTFVGDPEIHTDGIILSGAFDNLYINRWRCIDNDSAKLLFHDDSGTTYENIAYRNILFQSGQAVLGSPPTSSFNKANTHVVMRNVTFANQRVILDESGLGDVTLSKCLYENVVFEQYPGSSSLVDTDAECVFRTNHSVATPDARLDASTGDPLYVSVGSPNWDYRPDTGSPLLGTGTPNGDAPGPRGCGDPDNPNKGAPGDVAGLGFSQEPFEVEGSEGEIALPSIASTVAMGSLTVAAQAAGDVELPSIASTVAMGSLTLAAQAEQDIELPAIPSGAVMGDLTVSAGGVGEIELPSIPSGVVMGTLTVAAQAAGELELPSIASTAAMGSFTVATDTAATIELPSIASTATLGALVIGTDGWTDVALVDLVHYATLAGTARTCRVAFAQGLVQTGSSFRAYWMDGPTKTYVPATFSRPTSWGALESGTDYVFTIELCCIWPATHEITVEALPPGAFDFDPAPDSAFSYHSAITAVGTGFRARVRLPEHSLTFDLMARNERHHIDGDAVQEFEWFSHVADGDIPTSFSCRFGLRYYTGLPQAHSWVHVTRGVAGNVYNPASPEGPHINDQSYDRTEVIFERSLDGGGSWQSVTLDDVGGLAWIRQPHGSGVQIRTLEIDFVTGTVHDLVETEQPRGMRSLDLLAPFFTGADVPSWITDPQAAAQALNTVENVNLLNFQDAKYFPLEPFGTGTMPVFGVNHIVPDLHAGGLRIDGLRKQINQSGCRGGHFYWPDGTLVQESDFPTAVLGTDGLMHPLGGEHWMNEASDRDLAKGLKNGNFVNVVGWDIEHYTPNVISQAHMFYGDMGMRWEAEREGENYLLFMYGTAKGSLQFPGNHAKGPSRGRGRGLDAGAYLYWSLTDDDLRRRIRDRMVTTVAQMKARCEADVVEHNFFWTVSPSATSWDAITAFWSPWQHGLWVKGLIGARAVFEVAGETTTVDEIDAMKNGGDAILVDGLAQFVLDHIRDDLPGLSGLWRTAYERFYNETPERITASASFELTFWCMPALLDMAATTLDSTDYSKLSAVLEQVVHGRTGTTNVWDTMSLWEIQSAPVEANTIALPSIPSTVAMGALTVVSDQEITLPSIESTVTMGEIGVVPDGVVILPQIGPSTVMGAITIANQVTPTIELPSIQSTVLGTLRLAKQLVIALEPIESTVTMGRLKVGDAGQYTMLDRFVRRRFRDEVATDA